MSEIQDDELTAQSNLGRFFIGCSTMADILAFRTKREKPEADDLKALLYKPVDTSPCEIPPYRAPEDGDCA